MLTTFKISFSRRWFMYGSILAIWGLFFQAVSAQDLNGYYRGDNGGHYYVRTEGNLIYWFAEDQKGDWAHVFVGSLTQAGFEGEHFDVPKGRSNNSGRHSFRINSSARSFTRLSGSGSLGTATQAALPTGGLPEDRCVGGQESTIANITGCWDGGDGGKYYMSQRTIPGRGELVVWYGEQSNTNGRPLFSNIAFGTRSGNNIALDWVSVPKGTASGQGTLRLNIDNAGTITQLSQTGGFGATKWTRGGESAQVVDEQNILTKIVPKILSEIKIPQKRSNQRKKEQEQARQREQELAKQREQELARQREQELARQRDQELARQRDQELARQREQELARQREQELSRQREQELARQREQELARQREQKLARQREQELAREREQELSRQRERELSRQREQELSRQRERELARQREQELARQRERELAKPVTVDLRFAQSPIKNQGTRNTCITFAAAGALEAAYMRAGYGTLDFSEQFMNHLGKTFWLHPNWNEIQAKGEDGSETQIGAFGGGGGVGYIYQLAEGFFVPIEGAMLYRNTNYTPTDFAGLANSFDSDYWKKQRRMSDFNLNQLFLPLTALKQSRYYSVKTARAVTNPKDPDELERILASGKEVVWDHEIGNTPPDNMWTPCSDCDRGAHSMLLVGYNRSSSNPAEHYFIGKNSWGPTRTEGAQGFTYLSYDYIRRHGQNANYIVDVNPPRAWPELSFVDRWNLIFDGWRGQLDIYHLPGQSRESWDHFRNNIADNRLGSFYNSSGVAYRVNGRVNNNTIDFYLDDTNKNARWDIFGGRKFSYIQGKDPSLDYAAGIHVDLDGRTYGGFMTRNASDVVPAGTNTPRPFSHTSFQNSRWRMYYGTGTHELHIGARNDNLIAESERAKYFAFAGTIHAGATNHSAVILQEKANPETLRVRSDGFMGSIVQNGQMYLKHLNHVAGNLAGTIYLSSGFQYGLILTRL